MHPYHAFFKIHSHSLVWIFDDPHAVCTIIQHRWTHIWNAPLNTHLLLLLLLWFHSYLLMSVFSALSDSLCNLDIPVIDMELDGIFDLPHIYPFRNSVALLGSTYTRAESEEAESTALWRHWVSPLFQLIKRKRYCWTMSVSPPPLFIHFTSATGFLQGPLWITLSCL